MKVRRGTPADAPRALEIWRDAVDATHRFLTPEDRAEIDEFVAAWLPSAELWLVDCLDPGQGGSLDFTFGDKVINVRYYDFVWHVPDTDLCVLGAFEDSECSRGPSCGAGRD